MKTRWMDSPIGGLRLHVDSAGLRRIDFDAVADGSVVRDDLLDEVERQLAEYFAGQRREFDLPLAAEGTQFQHRVWSQLRQIAYGQTTSYGRLAQDLGYAPGVSRAVGAANGANPIPVVVPCHRVIGADGSLTGYAGGLDRKRILLDLERPALF